MSSHLKAPKYLLVLFFFILGMCTEVLGGDVRNTDPMQPSLHDKKPSQDDNIPDYVVTELAQKKLLRYYPELKGLVAAQSQQDLAMLLEKVGANVDQLWNAVPSATADESVIREQLDKHGWPTGFALMKARYSYLIRAHMVGEGVRLSEGRSDLNWQKVGTAGTTRYELISGFAILPLHFHPFHQAAATFRYLGRQVVDNREDYVIAFAQQPQKAELLGAMLVNGTEITVAYQGVAWIDPDTFQVVRIRIDLLHARPEAGTQKTEVRFSEVRLPVVNKSFWLPLNAVVTRSAKGGAIREKHDFSDYRIFVEDKNVSATPPVAQTPK